MGSYPLDVKFNSGRVEDLQAEDILRSFPELKSGVCGSYSITALQVASAFTKSGVMPLLEKLLTAAEKKYVNQGDQLGRTPLHYAVMNANSELAKLLLDYGADPDCQFLYLCSFKTSKGDYGKWNKLYSMLPPPDGWKRTPLHNAAKSGFVNIVSVLINYKANVNVEDEKGITPLLLAGSDKNRKTFEDIVDLLVGAGANVNVRSITGTTPLFHAVAMESFKATTILLRAGAWLTEGPSLQTELHEAATRGALNVLKLFLQDERLAVDDVNKVDECGRTPLFKAALGGHRECLKALISKGGSLGHVSKTKETVMDVIFARISRPSHFIKELLDSRITGSNFRPTDEKFLVKLDFSILAPYGNDRQMDVISSILIAANEREKFDILQHPLIETFLRLKWTKIRQFFFLLIFSYMTFVISLSIYMILFIHARERSESVTNVVRYFVIVTAGGLSGHAIIQCILARRNFWNQYEVLMNLASTILSLIVITSRFGVENSQDAVSPAPKWILHASSIAVLLAWTELMLLIGRFPTYGYYALMFAAVLQNVIKVLLTFVCLVIGFALSFSIQFHEDDHFSDPWKALVKTTVMMMGEFEYGDLFSNPGQRLHTTSRVIFLLFVIIASIVLMNLMVGVAVSDIQGLQQEGHSRRLEKQAEFLRELEQVISHRVVDSKWFPAFVRKFLKRKRCINLILILQPAHKESPDAKKTRQLPCELIDAIVRTASNQQGEREIQLGNLPEIISGLKRFIRKYERRLST